MDKKRFFIAGIIQGSKPGLAIHRQDYRAEIAKLLREAFPGAEVFDPVAEYPGSVHYPEEKGRAAFFDLMERAGKADALIAFIPEASMGTAIELWRARERGALVVCVSPLSENWVVKFLADKILPDMDTLASFIKDGGLEGLWEQRDQKGR
jgi:hypothetical protein